MVWSLAVLPPDFGNLVVLLAKPQFIVCKVEILLVPPWGRDIEGMRREGGAALRTEPKASGMLGGHSAAEPSLCSPSDSILFLTVSPPGQRRGRQLQHQGRKPCCLSYTEEWPVGHQSRALLSHQQTLTDILGGYLVKACKT